METGEKGDAGRGEVGVGFRGDLGRGLVLGFCVCEEGIQCYTPHPRFAMATGRVSAADSKPTQTSWV